MSLPARSQRVAIIADDLTGATDAAVPFAKLGFPTKVLLDPKHLGSAAAAVVALTTNSRQLPPAAARRKVRAACQALARRGARLIYKKMDSTVQGNIVAEAEAARDGAGFETVLLCPANPSQGRVVHHGLLTVWGKPLAQLERYLGAQGLSDFTVLRSPLTSRKVARVLRQARFVIADSATEMNLALLVEAALSAPRPVLLAGSAGMVAQLAKRLAADRQKPPKRKPAHDREPLSKMVPGPPLIFCGSRNPVTQRQIALLLRRPGPVHVPLTRHTGEAILPTLQANHAVVVTVPIHVRSDQELLADLRRLSSFFRPPGIGGLLLTGGDTALLVCRWLRPHAIELRGELLPGLSWGFIRGGRADGLLVCTKPGGFGSEESLLKAVELLSGNS
jgi:uncharacterized protein YgbK (DUF1537 family)